MAEIKEDRPTGRLQRRLRLPKRRILFAAIFMLIIGYGVSILLAKTDVIPSPAPHQVLQQAK